MKYRSYLRNDDITGDCPMTTDTRHATAPHDPPTQTPIRPGIAGARRYGDQLITSGQTAHIAGQNIATGIVGSTVDLETARRCAWQCARNVVDAALTELGDLSAIASVTRVTVYVASTPEFTEQHLVGDAASQYFLEVFGPEAGRHTRSALGLASLPTGSPVEVEAIFQLKK
jgi:enamine deaminase RidA (YjgF/YER057c/UK114 family)